MRSRAGGSIPVRRRLWQVAKGQKRRHAVSVAIVLLLCLGLSALGADSDAATTGKLWGHITDAQTGTPIAGAVVTVVGHHRWAGQTDGFGVYSVSLPSGTYTVTASDSGHTDLGKSVRIRRGSTTQLDLALTAVAGFSPSLPPPPPPPPSGLDPVGVIRDGSAILAISDVPKPPYLFPIRPAPFRTIITRIAGNPGDPIPIGGTWNADARHHYSNDQPWNADQTLIAIDQPGGTPDLLFLDGSTYQPKFGRCASYNRQDDRWHPTMPNIRVNAGGSLLEWFDVVRCTQVKAWTLPFSVYYLGLTNGNVSQDGRFITLGDRSHMFMVDMVGNRIGPAVGIAYGGWTPTGLGVSPSGRYAWVHYSGDYNRVFDVDPTTLVMTPRPLPGALICHGTTADGFIYDLGHQDVALNPFDNNEDVMIGQEHCGNVGQVINGQLLGHVVMVRLRDGKITALTDPTNEAYAYHISARNYERPGWVYVSYYQNQPGLRFNQEIISVKMDGSKAVERWAHHHDDDMGCYRCEVHPVPSPDGLRIIINSVWNLNCDGGCGSLAVRQDYVVDGRPH